MRVGAALAKNYPLSPFPVYRLMFSDGMLFGYPPEPLYLDTYTHLHRQCDPYTPLMIAGLDVDVLPLIPHAVKSFKSAAIGTAPIHIRVGLEDAPLGTKESNASLVRQAVDGIKKAGGEVATASEVRSDLEVFGERRASWLEEERRSRI